MARRSDVVVRVGHERNELVKTIVAANTSAVLTAGEQPMPTSTAARREDERSEEAFEATIIQLDGATAERLFRLAGE